MSLEHPLKLLVAVDGSDASLRAAQHALRLCAEAPSADLVLISVQPPLLYVEAVLGPRETLIGHWSAAGAREALRRACEAAGRTGRIPVTEIIAGEPADAITQRAREINADLILMGTRGLNPLRELVLGSVAKRVLDLAERPVVVVR